MSDLDIFALPTHPAADVFPMLSEMELKELAADIEANGQHTPIIVGEIAGVMTLIDGRNRRAACKLAGLEPKWVVHNGGDPLNTIWSCNVARRHLTQGQMAICAAMMFPSTSKGGRGNKSDVTERFGVSAASLSMARQVFRENPELAEAVRQGDLSLKAAHQKLRPETPKVSTSEELPDDSAKPFTGEGLGDNLFEPCRSFSVGPWDVSGEPTRRKQSNCRRMHWPGFTPSS